MERKILPVGIDDFKKVRKENYYYTDKTFMIKELLDMKGEVNLFTRPRRFGKTLNMSMLQCFFEYDIHNDNTRELFQGLKIMDAGEKYLAHMGRYPVILLSLKSMKQFSYEDSFYCLKEEICREYKRHDEMLDGLKYASEREKFLRMIDMTASPQEYLTAIRFLSECMYKYYGKKAIILIDEYDVPLENAYFSGFYEQMVSLLRSLFESALKTNENLEFAVLTGCLRISKESIFTGLNNLEIVSVLNERYAEHFGFTQSETDEMLKYYGLEEKREIMRKWYDGYCFGNVEVYNPWSVINYIKACTGNKNAFPEAYWSNTSSNSIVRALIERADISVRQEIERLVEGETIVKPVHEDITYEDIDSSQDNLWNFLFFTGYLKKINEKREAELRYIEMAIPNNEVRYIYKTTVLRWFEEQIGKKDLSVFYGCILKGNTEEAEEILAENLMETISYYDYQESFYHGFLAGMFKNIGNYIVLSNREAGTGRPDIVLKYPSVRGKAVILELKTVKSYDKLEEACDRALWQIEEQRYEEELRKEGYRDILKYGIAFCRKDCMVKKA